MEGGNAQINNDTANWNISTKTMMILQKNRGTRQD